MHQSARDTSGGTNPSSLPVGEAREPSKNSKKFGNSLKKAILILVLACVGLGALWALGQYYTKKPTPQTTDQNTVNVKVAAPVSNDGTSQSSITYIGPNPVLSWLHTVPTNGDFLLVGIVSWSSGLDLVGQAVGNEVISAGWGSNALTRVPDGFFATGTTSPLLWCDFTQYDCSTKPSGVGVQWF